MLVLKAAKLKSSPSSLYLFPELGGVHLSCFHIIGLQDPFPAIHFSK